MRFTASTHALHIFGEVGDELPAVCDLQAVPLQLPGDVGATAAAATRSSASTLATTDLTARYTVRGKRYALVGTGEAGDDLDDSLHYVVNFWPVVPGAIYSIVPVISEEGERGAGEKTEEEGDGASPSLKEAAATSSSSDDKSSSEAMKKKVNSDNAAGEKKKIEDLLKHPLLLRTPRSPFKDQTIVVLGDKSDVVNPGVIDLAVEASDRKDYIFLFEPGPNNKTGPTDLHFLSNLFWNALFLLPNDESPVSLLPNANRRFCIDLDGTNVAASSSAAAVVAPAINWLASRKCRKYLKEFDLLITREFEPVLKECAEYHVKQNDSTWLDEQFIHALQLLARDPNSKVQLMAFVLREKKSGKTAAATFGFACGRSFHDFTMCTMMRDHRSCGTLITKLAGMILQQAKFSLWYWGMKSDESGGTSYMKFFEDGYGGVEIPNAAFYERWVVLREQFLPRSLGEVAADVCANLKMALVTV